MKFPALSIVVAAFALTAGSVMAQGYGYGAGFGPGMRGGWGPGEGYGPGMGYGAGMGYGRGMGYGPRAANLTDEQRTQLAAVRESHREKSWKTMGELQKERVKLSELYAASKPDARAIAEQEKKVDALREQMFKQRNDMRRDMQALLPR